MRLPTPPMRRLARCRPTRRCDLLTAARSAFTEGLAIAAGVGSALLLASAAAVWLLLKPRPVPPINRRVESEGCGRVSAATSCLLGLRFAGQRHSGGRPPVQMIGSSSGRRRRSQR
jgi:hypothetical protein